MIFHCKLLDDHYGVAGGATSTKWEATNSRTPEAPNTFATICKRPSLLYLGAGVGKEVLTVFTCLDLSSAQINAYTAVAHSEIKK